MFQKQILKTLHSGILITLGRGELGYYAAVDSGIKGQVGEMSEFLIEFDRRYEIYTLLLFFF